MVMTRLSHCKKWMASLRDQKSWTLVRVARADFSQQYTIVTGKGVQHGPCSAWMYTEVTGT